MNPGHGHDCLGSVVARLRYIGPMKTASLPSIRVEPELRTELESVLGEKETLTDFMEMAVRRAVEQRRVEVDFRARAEAAWQDYQRTGVAVPADEVLAKLQDRIDAKRKALESSRGK